MKPLLIASIAPLVVASAAALAADPAWPPPEGVEARMHTLEAILASRESTREQRDAARSELGQLLMSPSARERGAKAEDTKAHPPRAAIEPFPSVVEPAPRISETPAAKPSTPQPGVAHLDVTRPAATAIDPRTGSPLISTPNAAVDPTTGHVLHAVPGGYIDPRTGRFIPH